MICSLRVDSSKPESRKRVGSFTPPVFIFYFYFSCKSTLCSVGVVGLNYGLDRPGVRFVPAGTPGLYLSQE